MSVDQDVTLEHVLDFIGVTATEADVEKIVAEVRARQKELTQRRSRMAAATLKVGDRVLTANIRPLRYSGVTGEIVGSCGTARKPAFTVKIDGGGSVGMPASCLTKVAA